MPFTLKRTIEIQTLIRSRLEQNTVTDWERSFLSNMDAEFAKHGPRTSLSKAQYAKLHKILGIERETPTTRATHHLRPVPQNPITAARRAIYAPKRAMRRAERRLLGPAFIGVALIAFIGALSGPIGNTHASYRAAGPLETAPRASYIFVTGSRVNQRQGPSTSHAIIGSLAEGARVETLSQEGSWTHIRSDLGEGWMASRFLSPQRPIPRAAHAPQGIIRPSDIRVIDGDTIKYRGRSIRLGGFDTPETYYAKCAQEKARGDAATRRLRHLIRTAGRLQLILSGEYGRYGRELGQLLVDGRDVGDVLISEGLARPYSGGRRQGWC